MKRFRTLAAGLLAACALAVPQLADAWSWQPPSASASRLAARLGAPSRLLIGLGSGNEVSDIQAQGLKPDILDRYLVGVGAGSWPSWNSPSGAYVDVVTAQADSLGAIPMFTLYQMASNGDGNLSGLNDATFMSAYWANARLLFQRLAAYGKPALVNVEPDFWGYVERQAPSADPGRMPVQVQTARECTSLPDDVTGFARCMMRLRNRYARNAYLGFPPSDWGGDTPADVVAFMRKVYAQRADFVVMQTLDRDAGCFEAASESICIRGGGPWYWDETNTTHPNFQDHLAVAQAYHDGIQRPLIWWQTPLGRPSATAGGTPNHYRDDRVDYFLKHPDQLTAVGGLGVVFGTGAGDQTTITSDGGQFRSLSKAYLAQPAALR
jgi:hypothetical protein